MKAVLMRRHQTMADVVPITTLLAILICIGYCSDTAGGTTPVDSEPEPLVVKDKLPSKPVTNGPEVLGQTGGVQESSHGQRDGEETAAAAEGPADSEPTQLNLETVAITKPEDVQSRQLGSSGDTEEPGNTAKHLPKPQEGDSQLLDENQRQHGGTEEPGESQSQPGLSTQGDTTAATSVDLEEAQSKLETKVTQVSTELESATPLVQEPLGSTAPGAGTAPTPPSKDTQGTPQHATSLLPGAKPETTGTKNTHSGDIPEAEEPPAKTPLPAVETHTALTSPTRNGAITPVSVADSYAQGDNPSPPASIPDSSDQSQKLSVPEQQVEKVSTPGHEGPSITGGEELHQEQEALQAKAVTLSAPSTANTQSGAEERVLASPGVGGTGHVGSQQQASLAGRPTGLVGVGQGAPAVQSTPDSTPSDGGPSVRTETTTTDPAHTSAAGRITQPVDTAGVQDKTKTKGATLSSTTPRAGDVKVEIPLAAEETAPVETPTPLPGAALTPPSTPTLGAPQQQGITPPSRDTTGPTIETGAGTTADGDTSAPVTVKVTAPVDTAGTLPGTTDSRTTRQGPSPPAGASQASADVTVQQGPTPEEKKEQQKEVTGITPQGSPRQEGQQQKGQTPQGPPPLGSTSGATPGKDNTRETAKTPPTGTDTNNNNNNITIPKIAVNETIISATVVPSAIPAVLVCSVVFLYLSRR